jgi:hypothetical protein
MIQFPFVRLAQGTDAPFRLFPFSGRENLLALNTASQTFLDLARHGGEGELAQRTAEPITRARKS